MKILEFFILNSFKNLSRFLFRLFFVSTVAIILIQSDDLHSQIMFFNTQIQTGESMRQIVTGASHTCALFTNGRVKCWGLNTYGQLGYGNTTKIGDDESPISQAYVNVGGFVKQITAGGDISCALLSTGAVRCWGYGGDGALGYGNINNIGDNESPASAGDVSVGAAAKEIAAGGGHTCALLVDGNVRCWGYGAYGQLGYGNTDTIGNDEAPSTAGDVNIGGAATQIVTGLVHTCALLTDGNVRCWGLSDAGPLGYGNTNRIGDNEAPSSAGNVNVGGIVKQISAGAFHTCALLADGNVRCWGDGGDGQLGYGNTNTIGDDEAPSTAGNILVGAVVTKIKAAGNHTCAILSDGNIRCWGRNNEGQLGYGNTTWVGQSDTPSSVGNVPSSGSDAKIIDISPGGNFLTGYHTCALYSSGKARCWGRNVDGQLGYADTSQRGHTASTTPDKLGYVGTGGEVTVKQVAVNSNYTSCALFSNGRVKCWGNGQYGQLGQGNTTDVGGTGQKLPIQIGMISMGGKVKYLGRGGVSAQCVIMENGKVRCWGEFGDGQLGVPSAPFETIGDNEVPQKYITNLTSEAVQIETGRYFSCALLKNGTVKCWGRNNYGQLGVGNTTNVDDPDAGAAVGLGEEAVQISMGFDHACAVLKSGGVRCWGTGGDGQLGYGNTNDIGDNELPSTAGPVSLGGNAIQVSAGERHTCALLEDGNVKCWGFGTFGELGYGNTNTIGDNELPSSVGVLDLGEKAIQIEASRWASCALLASGRVRCWGQSIDIGGYGDGTAVGDDETPGSKPAIQLGGNAIQISVGNYQACAVLETGNAICWGDNSQGQLGIGNNDSIGDDEHPYVGGNVKLLPNPENPAPPNPTNLAATVGPGSDVNLSWRSGGGSTCDYRISYQTGATAPATCADPTQVSENLIYGNAHTLTLASNTQYSFRVCAINCDVPTPEVSSGVTVTATTLQAVPPDPTGLIATPISDTQIDLSWSSGGGTTADYRISYLVGSTPPATCSTGNTIGEGLITGTSYSVTGLTEDTTYTFRVCAINSNPTPDESPGSTVVSATFPLPPRYRSVGTSAVLAQGSSGPNNMVISGTTATFASALPNNIGVGDAIVYDCSGNSALGASDCIAFIHGRTSSTVYTIRRASGSKPVTYASNQYWSIYRAYTTLAGAQAGTENASIAAIDATVANFDSGTFKDLVAGYKHWNIALYSDAVDTTAATVSGWTTSTTNYLKLYTPVLTTEVGVSQRHNGAWQSSGAYTLNVGSTASDASLIIDSPNVYVEGLQIAGSDSSNNSSVVRSSTLTNSSRHYIHSNIIRGTFTDASAHRLYGPTYGTATTGQVRFYNNILYFDNQNNTATIGFRMGLNGATAYVYNNTFIGAGNAINRNTGTVVAKNNLTYYCMNACFSGTFTTSNYNSSADMTTTGGANDRTLGFPTFYDPKNGDYRLATEDTAAEDLGTDLSADVNLAFNVDIAGNARTAPWDIGASVVIGGTLNPDPNRYRSMGYNATTALECATGGCGMVGQTLTVSGSTATFSTGVSNNVGVGDAIQYDSDNNSSIDSIAFIHGRTSSTVFTIKKADGSTPNATAVADADWAIYRAYTTFQNASDGVENTGINAAVVNFDSGNFKNIGLKQEIWNIALYAGNIEYATSQLTINNWKTTRPYYLKFFVPYLSSQVGTSQRHSGVWDTTKYILSVNDDSLGAIYVESVDNAYFDGMQIDVTDKGGGITFFTYQGVTNLGVSNSIIRGNAANNDNGIRIESGNADSRSYVYNNIIYDFDRGISLASSKNYLYNNTIVNVASEGMYIYCAATSALFKNNIVQNAGLAAYEDSCGNRSDPASNNNISDDSTDTNGSNDQINATVKFMDATNDDYRLSPADGKAVDNGLDLSADPNLAFNNDIAMATRTTWDIGAQEAVGTGIFRSVGTLATAIQTGSSNANNLTISGKTATFSKSIADNIGVGDALQYDSDGNSTIDQIAFVFARIDNNNYKIRKADGSDPVAVTNDQDWSFYRAYTSLSNAETGTENTGIDDSVENFDTWSGGKDLVTAQQVWSLACYGDGVDTSAVTIDGWTTNLEFGLNIYTPVESYDVGTSQRHSGYWGSAGYELNVSDPVGPVIDINDENVSIEGLRIGRTGFSNNSSVIGIGALGASAKIYLSANLIRGFAPYNIGVGVNTNSGINSAAKIYFYNNIVHDLATTGGGAGIRAYGLNYIYNNTFVNPGDNGIDSYTPFTHVIKNNIVQGSNANAYTSGGGWDASNNYNLSDDASTTGGANDRASKSVRFVDAANFDYRLSPTDREAKDLGTSLASDANIAFTNDITGRTRAVWDIGAHDTDGKAIYRSVGPNSVHALATGAGNSVTITSGDDAVTFASALPKNAGVGDALVFDCSGNAALGTGDCVIFISHRYSDTSYLFRKADGSLPSNTYSGTTWSLYRAYTSLSGAESGTENASIAAIDATLGNFDSGNRNIATNNEIWNVALYADAPETAGVDLYGWTTSKNNYFRIFAPYKLTEVGISQRHSGVWDDSKATINTRHPNYPISDRLLFSRIEGLQIKGYQSGTYQALVSVWALPDQTPAEFYLSDNIITDNASSVTGFAAALSISDLQSGIVAYVFNNIIYDFLAGPDSTMCLYLTSGGTYYIYNNTMYSCDRYYMDYTAYSGFMYLKNNILDCDWPAGCLSATDKPYIEASNNVYSVAGETYDGANEQSGTLPTFENAAGKDFRLADNDTIAKNKGITLASTFPGGEMKDYINTIRPQGTGWDIGGHEAGASYFVDDDNGGSEFGGGSYSNSEYSSGVRMKAWTAAERELQNADATFDTTNLVGIWHINGATMNETTNPTLADSGPNGLTATISTAEGATNKSVAGKLNESIDLDGTDDFVSVPAGAAVDNLSAITVSAWIYPETGAADGCIACKINADTHPYGGWMFHVDASNYLSFKAGHATTSLVRTVSQPITLNTWHHVAVTWDGSTTAANVKIYLDGVEQSYSTTTNASGARDDDSTYNLGFGRNPSNTNQLFDGRMDEILLFGRVLGNSEISEIFSRQYDQFGGGEVSTFTSRVIDATTTHTWSNLWPKLALPMGKEIVPGNESSGAGGYTNGMDLSANLVGYWNFNGPVDQLVTTAANRISDLSSNNIHGTGVDTDSTLTFKTAPLNQGLDFDGANDAVSIADNSVLNVVGNRYYTWSMRFKADTFTEWNPLYSAVQSSTVFLGIYAHTSATMGVTEGIGVEFYNGAEYVKQISNDYVIQSGQWYQLTVTYDSAQAANSRFKIYINGVDQTKSGGGTSSGTINGSDTINPAANQIRIGGYNDGTITRFFDGMIDEVAIWGGTTNAARFTASQALDLYRRGKGNFKVQVETCDDGACSGETFAGPDGTAATYFTEAPTIVSAIQNLLNFPPNRYFRYQVTLENGGDSSFTPVLERVRINANQ